MFKSVKDLIDFCTTNSIKIIDFKLADLNGRWHHLSIPAARFNEKIFEEGIGFDGSSYGFMKIENSDMVFVPDISTAFIDPFCEVPTLSMIADIFEIKNGLTRYESDPRYISEKAEKYMLSSEIADQNVIGPEFEFYLFDSVSYANSPNHTEISISSEKSEWTTNEPFGNGYHVSHKGGYHVDLPNDGDNDFRSKAVVMMEDMGIPVKYHHHEVGGPGQMEIEVQFDTMHSMADKTLLTKYILKNLAVKENKSVTFMPKPLDKECGSGMHVHMMLWKDGKPLFYDKDGYSGLSQTALYFIGGLLKHSPALLAFTNPSTNSYKRLVPGYEAPISICFATSNRSSVVRIPGYANKPENKRFEFRPSDATCNPYLAYSAMLMAGLDGIKNKIDPIKEGYGPYDVNIFELSEEEKSKIKSLPHSLEEALKALDEDQDFLLSGGVFTKELIKNWIKEKYENEYLIVNNVPHPMEFALYYDL